MTEVRATGHKFLEFFCNCYKKWWNIASKLKVVSKCDKKILKNLVIFFKTWNYVIEYSLLWFEVKILQGNLKP
jgi:hypothetical protein